MKLAGCADVDLYSKRFLQLDLQARHSQQAGARRRIDEQIEVAPVLVFTVEDGAEDARVGHAGLKNKLADGVSMLGQNLRGAHCIQPLACFQFTRNLDS
jgi:hypothetical protein